MSSNVLNVHSNCPDCRTRLSCYCVSTDSDSAQQQGFLLSCPNCGPWRREVAGFDEHNQQAPLYPTCPYCGQYPSAHAESPREFLEVPLLAQ